MTNKPNLTITGHWVEACGQQHPVSMQRIDGMGQFLPSLFQSAAGNETMPQPSVKGAARTANENDINTTARCHRWSEKLLDGQQQQCPGMHCI